VSGRKNTGKNTKMIKLNALFKTRSQDIREDDKRDPVVLYRIETDLEIIIEENIFFKEDVAIGEFYIELKRWLLNIENQVITDFGYYTIEYDEDIPILEFKVASKGIRIQSIWGRFQV
jgi:hypothetical protein